MGDKLFNKIIEYCFYCLFFLVPLVMTPINYELFEYNKMMLVYALTVIIVGAWLGRMVLQRKILIRRTPFDIPLLLFLASQILSTIFSIDRHTSLWGYYSRFHGGLLSTLAYIFLFYAYVSNFSLKEVKKSLSWLLGSAFLVGFYGVLEHFGIDADYWVQDVQARVFSTLGQPNWLAAWLAILIPLPIALILPMKFSWSFSKKSLKLAIGYLLLSVFILCLLYTKSRSGLLGFGVSWLVFWGGNFWLYRHRVRTLLYHFLASHLLILILASLAGTPFTPSFSEFLKKLPREAWAQQTVVVTPTPTIIPEIGRGGTESYQIRKIVWQGALDIFRAYPLFGSGVETFAYSYYQFRPVEHNLVSEWDFLYNKAHNEYLNFLATTGAVGLGSYLLLIGWIIFWNTRKIFNLQMFKNFKIENSLKIENCKIKNLTIALFAGWLSIPVTNFFGFSVVPVALLFFLFPAASVILTEQEEKKKVETKLLKSQGNVPIPPPAWKEGIVLIVISFVCFYLLYLVCRFWYADTLFAQAKKMEKQGAYFQAFELSRKAISLNKNEPLYLDTLAFAAASVCEQAFLLNQKEEAAQYAALAIEKSDKALDISPYHLNFWKTRAKIFYKLSSLDAKYLQDALETLKKAGKLAPTDAKIFYNMGLVYLQQGETGKAIETLEKTVKMKENYQDARYALALIYAQEGDSQKAIEHLEYLLTYINPLVSEARELYKKLTGEEFGE